MVCNPVFFGEISHKRFILFGIFPTKIIVDVRNFEPKIQPQAKVCQHHRIRTATDS